MSARSLLERPKSFSGAANANVPMAPAVCVLSAALALFSRILARPAVNTDCVSMPCTQAGAACVQL